ncbi:hypothetical protein PBI_GAIA_56 [Mycobacterium phage Gaia]|uniref:Uncharacterized protein n=1 Tax=Mycobacterium phage Gaia TaxID=1486472 RepID=A0A068F8P1_9CAUD|nr:hypothetical protein VC46_gp177 [Mycobacterium phage Gaia]AID58875.1 hypothetical protein PBI_GAIA_56 [Mycobacterium phage Gaia]
MPDPAVKAAERAWRKAHPEVAITRGANTPLATPREVAAASEALYPIRNLVSKFELDPIGGWSLDDFLAELYPLIYPDEELS